MSANKLRVSAGVTVIFCVTLVGSALWWFWDSLTSTLTTALCVAGLLLALFLMYYFWRSRKQITRKLPFVENLLLQTGLDKHPALEIHVQVDDVTGCPMSESANYRVKLLAGSSTFVSRSDPDMQFLDTSPPLLVPQGTSHLYVGVYRVRRLLQDERLAVGTLSISEILDPEHGSGRPLTLRDFSVPLTDKHKRPAGTLKLKVVRLPDKDTEFKPIIEGLTTRDFLVEAILRSANPDAVDLSKPLEGDRKLRCIGKCIKGSYTVNANLVPARQRKVKLWLGEKNNIYNIYYSDQKNKDIRKIPVHMITRVIPSGNTMDNIFGIAFSANDGEEEKIHFKTHSVSRDALLRLLQLCLEEVKKLKKVKEFSESLRKLPREERWNHLEANYKQKGVSPEEIQRNKDRFFLNAETRDASRILESGSGDETTASVK